MDFVFESWCWGFRLVVAIINQPYRFACQYGVFYIDALTRGERQ
jgi:hypothetical protein